MSRAYRPVSVSAGVGRSRRRAPRFTLAIPAWLLFVLFFAIPVLLIVWYSFGYKPDIFNTVATDRLSFER
ncbi:MAG: spermidine/putrescine transporter permease, partial [Actinomycetia bacterium]|nr:spermidine/putrescine transporter permease [Actinomycetes bacterium]